MVKKSRGDRTFEVIVYAVLIVIALITLFPLVHILACSFSDPLEIYAGKIVLLPVGWTIKNYQKILETNLIVKGYLNTILYAGLGTLIGLALQMSAGYVLTRKDLPFRGVINAVFLFTMFFNGGMIPTYLVVKSLGMLNTIWSMIIPGCVSVYNVIIIRTYINSSVPWDMTEAAVIDGANDLQIFFRIILPLSKPIIAVMVLYGIVGYWNSYFNALIYVTNEDLHPLQMILRKILISSNVGSVGNVSMGSQEQALLSESIKYATIVVATLPILIIFPFFQKYFEKGIMIGSLKG